MNSIVAVGAEVIRCCIARNFGGALAAKDAAGRGLRTCGYCVLEGMDITKSGILAGVCASKGGVVFGMIVTTMIMSVY